MTKFSKSEKISFQFSIIIHTLNQRTIFVRAKHFFKAFLALFFLGFAFNADSKHIIGGDISYNCVSSGNYIFTFTLYRDCASQGGAPFDEPANFTIYRGTEFNNIEVQSVLIDLDGPPEFIPIATNNCQQLSQNLCVERGTYTFPLNLPVVNTSYFIVYQRCCRNNTITNIIEPEATGSTYAIELLPAAQTVCNDSPIFNEYPPALICANEPLVYDHSATDPDGDALNYRFCTPLDGGGLGGVDLTIGDANDCNGVQPIPACAPPFNKVNFQQPSFDELNPMGGNPQVDINLSSGLITGTPEFVGQYVVGVCVEEYRDGVLLSRSLRDFQFNVSGCIPFVEAILENGEQHGDTIVLNFCGEDSVEIKNLSIQENLINSFSWHIDSDGDGIQEPFFDWSPHVAFSGEGTYQGQLSLFGQSNCNDSAYVEINIFPDLEAKFDFSYDTCIAGETQFFNYSFTNAISIDKYEWDFGDGNTSEERDPVHQYMIPGNLPVSLTITDNNGCRDTLTENLAYFPAPSIVIINPSESVACAPSLIKINNLSFPIDSTYTINWDLGDGSTSQDISPLHLYQNPGTFSLAVHIISPIGCEISGDWPDIISTKITPLADFDFAPSKLTEFEKGVQFTDQSVDSDFYEWIFDRHGHTFDQNPFFEFPDTGRQVVTQIVEHIDGCKDTLQRILDIEPFFHYDFPNAFTPNGDGNNEFFLGKGYQENVESYHLWIYNRWGELVFETQDPNLGWNGRKNNVGRESPQGGYLFVAEVSGARGAYRKFEGMLILLR